MKKILLPVFLFGALCGFSQVPSVQWQKILCGTSIDKGNAIQQTADGGYIIAGETTSNNGDVTVNNGTTDYWVAKIDSLGVLQWQKSLGGSGDDRANAVTQTADGGYMVVGASNSAAGDITAPKGQYDFWIVKLTSTGTISWQKSMGGTAIDEAHSVQQTADGGFVIAGESRSNNLDLTVNNGSSDYWVVKTDGLGVIQWQKALGGAGTDIAYSVRQTADGGYIVAGSSNSTGIDVTGNNGGVDFWVAKLSSTGTLTWQKSLGGTGSETAYSIKQTSDGGYIVAGKTDSNNGNVSGNNGAENAWVVKLTSTGSITWQDCFGGTGFDAAYSIQQTIDGGYVMGGSASSNSGDLTGNYGSNDFWIVKLTVAGVISWQKNLGGTSSDVAMGIQQTADNGYVIAGRSASSNNDVTSPKGLDDFWVVKFVGAPFVSTGISATAGNDALLAVYPNPGKGLVTVVNKSTDTYGQLRVTDVVGSLVYETTMTQQKMTVDLSAAAKGIYFLSLSDAVGNTIAVKKLVIE